MIKFAKWLTLCVSLAVVLWPKAPGEACYSGPDPSDYAFRFFNPANGSDPKLAMFYLTNRLFNEGVIIYPGDALSLPYNDSSYRKQTEQAGRQANTLEWVSYLQDKLSFTAVYEWLYQTDAETFLRAYGEQETDQSAHFSQQLANRSEMVRHVKKLNKPDLMAYMLISKKLEFLDAESDPWSGQDRNFSALRVLSLEVSKLLAVSNDAFLRSRLAYQAIRINRMLGNYPDINRVFDRYFNVASQNSCIYWWALAHKAYVLSRQPKTTPEADLEWVRIFLNCPEKRPLARQMFSGTQFSLSLKLATSDQDKLGLYLLKGLNNVGKAKSELLNVMEVNPNSAYTELLAIRELNKVEDWIWTPQLSGLSSWVVLSQQKEDRQYARELRRICELHGRKKSVKRRAFWMTMASYLALMDGKYSDANALLRDLKLDGSADSSLLLQQKAIGIMSFILNRGKISTLAEDSLYDHFRFLERFAKSSPDLPPLKDQFLLLLAWKYQKEGQFLKSALTFCGSNYFTDFESDHYPIPVTFTSTNKLLFYLNEKGEAKDTDSLLAMLKRPFKKPFELLLLKPFELDINRLNDLSGTQRFRMNQLELAVSVWEEIPESYWYDKGAAYTTFMRHYPFCSSPLQGALSEKDCDTALMSKPQIATRLIQLQKVRNLDPNAAQYWMEVGNAWYNLSWYGNSWIAQNFSRSDAEMSQNTMRIPNQTGYYDLSKAKQAYNKAYMIARDAEQKAICLAYMARCEDEVRFHGPDDGFNGLSTGQSYPINTHFETMKKSYREQRWVSTSFIQCSAWAEYLKYRP